MSNFDENIESDEELKQRIEGSVKKQIVEHRVIVSNGNKSNKTIKAQRESLALAHLENKKELLIERAKIHGIIIDEDDILNPYDLERKTGWLDSQLENKTGKNNKSSPAGKVRMNLNQPQDQSFDNSPEMVDDLYNRLEMSRWLLIKGSKDYDEKLHKKLQTQADQLLGSLIEGEKNRGEITRFSVWECPECSGTVNNSAVCPSCSYQYKDYNLKPNQQEAFGIARSRR